MLEKRSKKFEEAYIDYLNELYYTSRILFESAIEDLNNKIEKIKKGKVKRKKW